jgi:hypothetical protein
MNYLFKQDRKKIQLEQRMSRVINSTFRIESLAIPYASEARQETRSPRNLQCIIAQMDNEKTIVDCWPCMTTDLSFLGSSVFVHKAVPKREKYLFVLRQDEEYVVVHAECTRCILQPLGGYSVGFKFLELLNIRDYLALKMLLEMLKTPA